jgi:hypothetical protein
MAADPISAFQPAEVWYWNGTALAEPYMNISTWGGARYNLPTLRGQNYAVPYRAGQLTRGKYPDQRTLTLTMWVDGTKTTTGLVAGDPRLAFNNYWQQLRQLFWTRNGGGSVQGQLERNWWLTQNASNQLVTATTMAEIAGSMDPTMNSRLSAVASIDFLLSDPYFYGNQRTQTITTSGGTITAYGEGVVGEGFPSAVNSFTVQISKACTVTNTTLGLSFSYSGSASFPVTVDILRDTAVDNAGVNQVGNISHSGSKLWMALANGSNSITVSSGSAVFTWNDCYV